MNAELEGERWIATSGRDAEKIRAFGAMLLPSRPEVTIHQTRVCRRRSLFGLRHLDTDDEGSYYRFA